MTRFLFILAACLFVFLFVTAASAEDTAPAVARDVLCKIFFEDPEAFENEDIEKCDCIPFGTVEVCQCFDGGRQALTPNGQPCLRDPAAEDPRRVKPLERPDLDNRTGGDFKTVPVRHSGRVYLKTVTPDGKPHSLSRMDGDALDIVCPPGFGVEELKPVM
jgi:hypothetical protein